jgi:NAD(P)-dependent dehydrogenase (short-subunit alcohol dehydrogenase family)
MKAAQNICGQITAEGHDSTPHQADLSRFDDVSGMVSACAKRYGRVDVLLFNAGLGIPGGPVELDEKDWDTVAAVNNKGYFYALKAVLPLMAAQGSGNIVAISSIASWRYPGFSHFVYAATKAAMNQMTKYVALEYASRQIRANAVLPGMIDTPRIARVASEWAPGGFEEAKRTRDSLCPMGHTGSPWDIAHAAAFLASEEAKYITGAEIIVDGGLSCQFATPKPNDPGTP